MSISRPIGFRPNLRHSFKKKPFLKPLSILRSPSLPYPPCSSDDEIYDYFASLLSDEVAPNQTYTYGEFITKQVDLVMKRLQDSPNTNQTYMTIGECGDMNFPDPPCLRGIDCCIIVDNASGHFIKNGDVDIVIVGADRISANYDVANKIGTYEKAVVAYENNIPFYVAAPLSTFDMNITDGKEIKVEERQYDELNNIYKYIPKKARNPAFDVTPRKYITGIITESGLINVNSE